ncbi:hypothetical protein, variant [Aphanomyces invadans]|uniref:Peptidase C39-like domain-containing protein n=1 Tax=Aphanomyces invadans TaxID=157072 RepID=A0A024TGR7_9STRA|nr:hypothetical protein, variant [Aphanomyces invadans]ETV93248.1 hypothetical protein, variant [Aphanomyces invadans]|eukprot:XP_008878082.1 hypothetical protein, variant [Aphanomyces invadans]
MPGDDSRRFQMQLHKAMPTRSIWTIDLAAFLSSWVSMEHVDVHLWFSSTSMETNPAHAAHPYYSADYATDVARVAPLYAAWRDRSFLGHTTTAELKARMQQRPSVLVALVDATELQCCVWKRHPMHEYQGHFIVITSICDTKVYYVDPASAEHTACVIDVTMFDKARCHPSTDQDLLLVSLP